MKNGFFIVVDGIDGSGKSEVVKLLHNYLFSKDKKYRILTTREPTHGAFGSRIREKLRNEENPEESSKELMELFIKDREDHLKNTINPFLDNSSSHGVNIVICDRYYYSTIAFQGAQGLDRDELIKMNDGFRKPDIAFILDVEPSIALERIEHRAKEKFEKLEFMKKIRENFLGIPEMLEDNIKIIDSNVALNEVFNELKKEIGKILD